MLPAIIKLKGTSAKAINLTSTNAESPVASEGKITGEILLSQFTCGRFTVIAPLDPVPLLTSLNSTIRSPAVGESVTSISLILASIKPLGAWQ